MTMKDIDMTGSERSVMQQRPPQNTGLKKVTLVIEYGQERLSLGALRRLLNPATVELTVAHAEFDRGSAQGDLSKQTRASGDAMADVEATRRDLKVKLQDELTLAGFRVAKEMNCDTGDRSWKALTAMLEETEQELLVILSAPSRDESARADHFAYTLATHSPVSVLMLRRPTMLETGPISVMLCVDCTEASMNTVRKIGQYLPDVAQTALEVVTVQSPIYQENAILAPYVNQDVLDEALAENARMIFEIVTDILDNQGIPVQKRTRLLGSPATELGTLAEQEHPDLLVVGSHNRVGVLAWLMGSVSSQLMHWDTHNLLVIR